MLEHIEVEKILKQRPPFLFVDRVAELEKNKRIVTVKNVSRGEPFALYHFPGDPVFPGVFIIEAAAQAAAILHSLSAPDDAVEKEGFLALGGVTQFRFLRIVRPGDTLRIEVEIIKAVPGMSLVKAKVSVDDAIIAHGELSFAVAKG